MEVVGVGVVIVVVVGVLRGGGDSNDAKVIDKRLVGGV